MCSKEKDIDSVFRISCYQSNCLHQAIKRSVDSKLVIYLISLASKETLCAKDDRGNTPLHLACDYDRCISSQLETVKAFVLHCDETLDQRTNPPYSQSAFQYHDFSREAARKAAETEAKAKLKEQKEKEQAERAARDADTKAIKTPREPKDPKAFAGPKGGVPMGGAAAPGANPDRGAKDFAIRRSNTGSQALSQPAALAVPSGAPGPSSNDGKSTSGVKKKSRRVKEDKVTEESANNVRNFLKYVKRLL